MTMIRKNIAFKTLLAFSTCALLTACQTATSVDYNSRQAKIDNALERAAYSAATQGDRKQSLSYLERMYKRNSTDPIIATNYAAALREADYIDRASVVLAPFADDSGSSSAIKTEYAAIQLALGNYETAERYAQKAILQDEENAKAYQYLGISLDAQNMHEQAERAFRKGLDHWKGDPTSIMNNLALNLATQEHLEEAIEILYKAQAISPDRIEIERNLRIVTALYESQGGRAPKPQDKPAVPVTEVSTDETPASE